MENQPRTIKLNNGLEMPNLQYGTWLLPKEKAGELISLCFQNNVLGIDCAELYQNQKQIGEIFGQKLKNDEDRKKVWITSKLWCTRNRAKDVLPSVQQTLKDLQLKYLDLYLVHYPEVFPRGAKIENIKVEDLEDSDLVSVWKEMEKLVEMGLVKSIGVSNFSTGDLEDLMKGCKIKPAVNQIELHPYNTEESLSKFCRENGIVIQSYSVLANQKFIDNVRGKEFASKLPPMIQNEVIVNIGKKYGKNGAQIALKWNLQKGNCVIFKTESKERLEQNLSIFDFQLTAEEMEAISKLNQNYKVVYPSFHNWAGKRYKAI